MPDRLPPDRPPNPFFEKARALGGPLAAQLAAYDAMLRDRNPSVDAAYQELVDRLTEAEAGCNAPAAGDTLPPFLLPDENGRLTSSAELLAAGPLIVSFNRGNWCPYCWLELGALRDCHKSLIGVGASIVSITPEVASFSRRLKRRLGLDFPVLTDLDNGYALQLGLAVPLTQGVRDVYAGAGIDLAAFQRGDGWFLPIPATFVVDRTGVVRHAYVNADFRDRIEPGELPKLIAAL